MLRAGPIRSDGQTDRHNPVLTLALRTVRQVPTGVLCIPFTGTLHGPPDRAAFGLIEAFRRRVGHGEDVVLELDSRRGLNLDLVRVRLILGRAGADRENSVRAAVFQLAERPAHGLIQTGVMSPSFHVRSK